MLYFFYMLIGTSTKHEVKYCNILDKKLEVEIFFTTLYLSDYLSYYLLIHRITSVGLIQGLTYCDTE